MHYLVTIVGRPNVGKSTLFNRLTESREAITDPTSGTTRDRKYGKSVWTDRKFTVIDTGGWITKSDDTFEAAIRAQVEISIEEADLILFMVDVGVGVTDLDLEIANMLRRSGKKVMVACNKVDTSAHDIGSSEFYSLGCLRPFIPFRPTTVSEQVNCWMNLSINCLLNLMKTKINYPDAVVGDLMLGNQHLSILCLGKKGTL